MAEEAALRQGDGEEAGDGPVRAAGDERLDEQPGAAPEDAGEGRPVVGGGLRVGVDVGVEDGGVGLGRTLDVERGDLGFRGFRRFLPSGSERPLTPPSPSGRGGPSILPSLPPGEGRGEGGCDELLAVALRAVY